MCNNKKRKKKQINTGNFNGLGKDGIPKRLQVKMMSLNRKFLECERVLYCETENSLNPKYLFEIRRSPANIIRLFGIYLNHKIL